MLGKPSPGTPGLHDLSDLIQQRRGRRVSGSADQLECRVWLAQETHGTVDVVAWTPRLKGDLLIKADRVSRKLTTHNFRVNIAHLVHVTQRFPLAQRKRRERRRGRVDMAFPAYSSAEIANGEGFQSFHDNVTHRLRKDFECDLIIQATGSPQIEKRESTRQRRFP